ncbi:MAG: phenylacetate--CoA ligase family protein [Burkholderiaceae bacterium]|nr:phenylacetate--CoA ligase family protein [Burkholderiaceae bacterium]
MTLTHFNAWQCGATALDVWSSSGLSAPALMQRQAVRLADMLRWAVKRSPLYRGMAGRIDPSRLNLDDFPVVTKPELMGQFDEWVTDPELRLDELRRFIADHDRIGEDHLGRYQVWESSGSSGEPGVFVQDAQALATYDALEALRRPLLQPLRRCIDPWYMAERLAFVGATTGHFASTASIQRLRRLSPWMSRNFQSYSFMMPLPELVDSLNRQAPTILTTYPSAALLLAEEAAAGRLRIPLNEVWVGGETLTASTRDCIVRGFGCPVSQSYGASEFLSLASECLRGRLHLNSDWVILQPVDARHRPVPVGETGFTTLLTNLANRVQPLIRYDLGDRVRFSEHACECGSALPVIEVQGRVDDLLVLDDAHGHPVSLLPLALTTVLEDDACVFDFQLQRRSRHGLWLCITADGADGAAALQRARMILGRFLSAQGLSNVSVGGSCGDRGQTGRSGKRQRVVADLHRHRRSSQEAVGDRAKQSR